MLKNPRQDADGRYRWHWDPGIMSIGEGDRDLAALEARLMAAARAIAGPILIVRGDESDVLSRETMAYLLEALPHVAQAEIPGARHRVAGDDKCPLQRGHTAVSSRPCRQGGVCAIPKVRSALYHGAGGMVVPSACLAFGVPFVLRRTFSRSRFWDDVRSHRVTALYYIGEVVRYLLAAKPRPDDRHHTLCKIAGVGLRPDIWRAFTQRFGIEQVCEGLGATEENYGLTSGQCRRCCRAHKGSGLSIAGGRQKIGIRGAVDFDSSERR